MSIEKKHKDLIFECKKCMHNLYVCDDKVRSLLRLNCPECGEEDYVWLLIGEGNFNETT